MSYHGRVRLVLAPCVALMALSLGCADETAPVEPQPTVAQQDCPAGSYQLEDGSCVEAGLPPDMDCPPGQWLADSGCVAAGVPPDGCADGFEHDGDRGCSAILPPTACPPGQLAVPGDSQCREIAPCGSGTWGDIPTEQDTQYVDASYSGGNSDGSSSAPWTTIGDAISAAADGAIVALAAGSYAEGVVIRNKSLRLWGRCPAMVEIVGPTTAPMAIDVRTGADGSVIRGVAVTGPLSGVVLRGSSELQLERLWIHDCGDRGLVANRELGPMSFTLLGSLVEETVDLGVFAVGVEATIDGCVVRDTAVDSQGFFGRGVTAQATNIGEPAALSLRGSVVERNVDGGVSVWGSAADVDATVVRDNNLALYVSYDTISNLSASLEIDGSLLEHNGVGGLSLRAAAGVVQTTVLRNNTATTPSNGYGIYVDEFGAAPASLELRRSLVDNNVGDGVYGNGATLSIESTAVRRTQLSSLGSYGSGVTALPQPASGTPSSLTLDASWIEDNHYAGVFVGASPATLTASVVRGTGPTASGIFGHGVRAQADPVSGAPASVTVDAMLVEDCTQVGIFAGGSSIELRRSVVQRTLPDGRGSGGRGVNAQSDPTTGARGSVTMFGTLIDGSVEAGVFASDSDVELRSCMVANTSASASGVFGDGVVVASLFGPGSATLTATRVAQSARSAIANFGGAVVFGSSELVCQTFDLFGSDFEGHTYAFDDRGDNLCGCPEAASACALIGESIEPPPPVGGLE